MVVLGAAAIVLGFAFYGWQVGLGVLAGSAIAYANFYWLEEVVQALADRVTASATALAGPERTATGAPAARESGGGMVARFLLRYALIALGAYVIFKLSLASLYGLLGGLFLTVGAIMCEGVYEAWAALRRGY